MNREQVNIQNGHRWTDFVYPDDNVYTYIGKLGWMENTSNFNILDQYNSNK